MCLPHAKDNKAVENSGFKAVLLIFNKIWKKPIVFTSERDISCYIFQNISRKKLILIHEKMTILLDMKVVLRTG